MEIPDAEVPPRATEGVVKYASRLVDADRVIADTTWRKLEAWRIVLFRLSLVGQTPDRYEGFGFGNLSARSARGFWITGTQTGELATLREDQYAEVVGADLETNRLEAAGRVHPSSEALTHAAIYAADPGAEAVFHGHSPEIWGSHEALELPTIDHSIEYGTPDMAHATAALLARHVERPLVFVTLGHEDGVFALGQSADATGAILVDRFAAALGIRR